MILPRFVAGTVLCVWRCGAAIFVAGADSREVARFGARECRCDFGIGRSTGMGWWGWNCETAWPRGLLEESASLNNVLACLKVSFHIVAMHVSPVCL